MARFDLFRTRSQRIPYLLDVQSDLLQDFAGRVVIPLVPERTFSSPLLPRLNPVITVEGSPHVLLTQEITTIPREKLRERVNNIEASHRDTITAAMDFLFQGF